MTLHYYTLTYALWNKAYHFDTQSQRLVRIENLQNTSDLFASRCNYSSMRIFFYHLIPPQHLYIWDFLPFFWVEGGFYHSRQDFLKGVSRPFSCANDESSYHQRGFRTGWFHFDISFDPESKIEAPKDGEEDENGVK